MLWGLAQDPWGTQRRGPSWLPFTREETTGLGLCEPDRPPGCDLGLGYGQPMSL